MRKTYGSLVAWYIVIVHITLLHNLKKTSGFSPFTIFFLSTWIIQPAHVILTQYMLRKPVTYNFHNRCHNDCFSVFLFFLFCFVKQDLQVSTIISLNIALIIELIIKCDLKGEINWLINPIFAIFNFKKLIFFLSLDAFDK